MTCFCKWTFIGTQPCQFISILSMAMFPTTMDKLLQQRPYGLHMQKPGSLQKKKMQVAGLEEAKWKQINGSSGKDIKYVLLLRVKSIYSCNYVVKRTHRSRVGTGSNLLSASGLFGDREAKETLTEGFPMSTLSKFCCLYPHFPSIKMGTGSEQRIYTVYVRISEPDSPQDDSVESCLSACSKWFTAWRVHGKWDS